MGDAGPRNNSRNSRQLICMIYHIIIICWLVAVDGVRAIREIENFDGCDYTKTKKRREGMGIDRKAPEERERRRIGAFKETIELSS